MMFGILEISLLLEMENCFDVLNTLNGRKFFIIGNHDNNSEFELEIWNRNDVVCVKYYDEIKIAGKK